MEGAKEEKEKILGTYTLECGHTGNIIYRGNDKHKTIGVQGTDRKCKLCGKLSSKDGSWSPTVQLIRTA